jgi:signal transduction histidine kinase/DNA-binding NarL/FixJ family response regulator
VSRIQEVAETTIEAERVESAERRYMALIGLAQGAAVSHDWSELARSVSQALDDGSGAAVRVLGLTSDGHRDLGGWPNGHTFPAVPQLDLTRAAREQVPTGGPEGTALVGLHADGLTLGVLQADGNLDTELLAAVAPVIACRFSVLAGQGVGDVLFSPEPVEQASDESAVIEDFAHYAKRRLDHDRLSVYLMSPDGRAFERFAVATSPIVPGEGVLIPFEDVGLKHVVLHNEPLVSSDIGADPRVVGREDRVIAQAGFRGLLSVPLRRRGRPFGVLNFVSREPGFYRREDVPVAEEIADQIAIFVENLRLQRRMQALVRQEATEGERARVFRDVYHTVAQAVREIEAATTDLEEQLGPDSEQGEAARQIRRLAEGELAGMRRAVIDMDPVDFDRHDLEEVARVALEPFDDSASPKATLEVKGDTDGIPTATQREAYRILQEALMNARLHSEADKVKVTLEIDRDLKLVVEDDGRGFDVPEGSGAGLGLRHMKDRTQALGGFLTIDSNPGKGTTVTLTVPGVREQHRAGGSAQGVDAGEAEMEGSLRVIVAEGNALLRAGICRMVERGPQMRVVGEAASADQLQREIGQLHPDVIVLSAALVNGDLSGLLDEVKSSSPSSAVLAISEGAPGTEAEMLLAGVNGVVPSAVDEEGFARAVRAVAEGTRVFPGADQQAPQADAPVEGLSERERSVLALVAAGRTNAEIGKNLYLATKTVERQVATIVRKLNARNRSHAAAIAVSRRIVQLPDD